MSEGLTTASGLEDAIEKAFGTNANQIFIIGGGEIYQQSMPVADTIYLTRVHVVLEGDAFFPVIDENEWELVSSDDFPADEKHSYPYSFQVWKKSRMT
jgi:dihydrofolate reductase